MILIRSADTAEEISQAKQLFEEYATSLGFSLCFQGFDKELAGLPGDYAAPSGRLFLAYDDEQLAGCVALHRFENEICEMKRLYVRPQFRGKKIGQWLIVKVMESAHEIGYKHMRLDTVSGVMKKAIEMYRSFGFREIPSYRPNPTEGVIYMEIDLPVAQSPEIRSEASRP